MTSSLTAFSTERWCHGTLSFLAFKSLRYKQWHSFNCERKSCFNKMVWVIWQYVDQGELGGVGRHFNMNCWQKNDRKWNYYVRFLVFFPLLVLEPVFAQWLWRVRVDWAFFTKSGTESTKRSLEEAHEPTPLHCGNWTTPSNQMLRTDVVLSCGRSQTCMRKSIYIYLKNTR